MENTRNPEITRVSWKHILVKQEGKLYGPDHFKAVLRAQNIDPYELDIVADMDIPRILKVLADEESLDRTGLIILKAISQSTRETELQKFTQTLESIGLHVASSNATAILNYYFAYILYMVTTICNKQMTEGTMLAICNQFSEAQISWGAQHAFWHMFSNGPNTEIGEKLYRDAFQRVLDMEMSGKEKM